MSVDIYEINLDVYNHMIDLFDYILALPHRHYNSIALKRPF